VVAPEGKEQVFQKTVNSAFLGTNLEAQLHVLGVQHVVIAGLTTPHCISTTTRMGSNLGFKFTVVQDATAAFDGVGPDGQEVVAEDMHYHSLAALRGEFAQIIRAAELIKDF
jgi:nicotinamidase-related amidase